MFWDVSFDVGCLNVENKAHTIVYIHFVPCREQSVFVTKRVG